MHLITVRALHAWLPLYNKAYKRTLKDLPSLNKGFRRQPTDNKKSSRKMNKRKTIRATLHGAWVFGEVPYVDFYARCQDPRHSERASKGIYRLQR